MKKVFGILAMMLAIAACNKNELNVQDNGITITATLAPKTVVTKVVSDQSTYIKAEWAENEHIAILYQVSSTKYVADARITAVDGSGTATISFTVEAGTPDDTPCTIVYPLSAAKDDHSGVKSAGVLLAAQDGTLNPNLDVRVGAGTIQTATPGLTVTTQPEPQFAIFKFTTKNADGSATIDVKPLIVSIGTLDYIITPTSATSEIYAALPPISGQNVRFTATSSDDTYINAKSGVTFSAGKYYKSDVKLNTTTLKYMIIPKGSNLSGDKLFYYASGETYKEAIDNNSENKLTGNLRWRIWDNGSDATIYFTEVSGVVAGDLSIDGYQHFGTSVNKDGITVNTVIDPNKNYYFVGAF